MNSRKCAGQMRAGLSRYVCLEGSAFTAAMKAASRGEVRTCSDRRACCDPLQLLIKTSIEQLPQPLGRRLTVRREDVAVGAASMWAWEDLGSCEVTVFVRAAARASNLILDPRWTRSEPSSKGWWIHTPEI
jgi:hypothetical protein